jgi:hypothetical protein
MPARSTRRSVSDRDLRVSSKRGHAPVARAHIFMCDLRDRGRLPFTRHHAVNSTLYSIINVVRTIEQILGLPPVNQYDTAAQPMFDGMNPAMAGLHNYGRPEARRHESLLRLAGE